MWKKLINKIPDCFGLEGALKWSHSTPYHRQGRFHYPRLLQAPSKLSLNTSRNRPTTTSSFSTRFYLFLSETQGSFTTALQLLHSLLDYPTGNHPNSSSHTWVDLEAPHGKNCCAQITIHIWLARRLQPIKKLWIYRGKTNHLLYWLCLRVLHENKTFRLFMESWGI